MGCGMRARPRAVEADPGWNDPASASAWAVHHVYSALLLDDEERTGLLASTFTGYTHLEQ